MNSRVSLNGSKFALPNGMTTSDAELKVLQQKLLQNYSQHYNQNVKLNSSRGLSNVSSRSGRQQANDLKIVEKQRIMNEFDTKSKVARQQFKHTLSNDLLSQIQLNNQRKRRQRMQTLIQESRLIQNNHKFDSLQRQKIKQFQNRYQKQIQQDKQIKQLQKLNQYSHLENQKKYYKNQQIQGFQRSSSLANLEKGPYANPTKQYCNQIQQAIRSRNSSIVNNPQAMQRSGQFNMKNDQKNQQQLLLKQSHYFESLKLREIRQREDLKQTLLSQILERQNSKKQQKRMNHQIPYTTRDYKFVHHPINNPVDFKHAHDNHYILQQLKSVI